MFHLVFHILVNAGVQNNPIKNNGIHMQCNIAKDGMQY